MVVVSVVSPCIKQCRVEGGSCSGCCRSLKQISEWGGYSVGDRMRIMEEIRSKVSTHSCPSCEGVAYCAMMDGKSSNLCWCMTVVRGSIGSFDVADCLCKECLKGGSL